EAQRPRISADVPGGDAHMGIVRPVVLPVRDCGPAGDEIVPALAEALSLHVPVVEPADCVGHGIACKWLGQPESDAAADEERTQCPLLLLQVRSITDQLVDDGLLDLAVMKRAELPRRRRNFEVR